MRVSQMESADGNPLTYYRSGEGKRVIVLANAPGMSIRFWSPVMGLLRDSFSVLGMEYRGYPDAGRLLSPEELRFDRFVEDLHAVLDAESIEEAHVVSWCLGGKLAWESYRRQPRRVRSIVAVGFAHEHAGSVPNGPFSAAMFAIKDRIERDEGSVASMVSMMKRVGFVPDDTFFESIFREEEDGPVLSLMDMLEEESSMSTLAFHLIDSATGLRNYLRTYEEFRKVQIADLFPRTDVPVTLVTGREDRITPLEPADRLVLDAIPGVRYQIVEGASHFVPVEFPHRLAALIREHVARVEEAALAPSA